jgi:nucleoid-associated protein YgaU
MGLFGKSFEEKVQSALENVRGQFPNAQINVRVENENVTLTGRAPDIDTKGRIMAAFNAAVETKNTINQIAIDPPAAPAPVPAMQPASPAGVTPQAQTAGVSAAAEPRTHVVASGETLSAIAKRFYGDASQYRRIFEANRDQLSDPDKIQVGQRLKIPT